MKKILSAELARFIIVGSSAAGVHFCLVLLQVQCFAVVPLAANILAFLISFLVSYTGHRFWTFSDTTLQHAQSLPRFFLVASSSFGLNEAMYFLLLRYTALPYWLSLGIVLVVVAAITFAGGRVWAFARSH
jgi:putative flippase GtrA